MRSRGFPLARIGAVLQSLPQQRPPTRTDWARIARSFDARIADLARLRDTLDGCIGCGCLSLRACALYNPADRAARHGPGPRHLLGDSPARG